MSRVLVWMLFTIGSMSMAAQTAPQVAAPAGRRLTLSVGQAPVVQKGTVIGRNDAAFLVSLKKDQNLLVDLQSPSTSLYFNVLPAKSPKALYASDRGETGNKATVAVPADGEYRVVVYLFRSAARRGAKVPFTLTLSVK